MSTTPRTDAAKEWHDCTNKRCGEFVPVEVARELETELALVTIERDDAAAMCVRHYRAHSLTSRAMAVRGESGDVDPGNEIVYLRNECKMVAQALVQLRDLGNVNPNINNMLDYLATRLNAVGNLLPLEHR